MAHVVRPLIQWPLSRCRHSTSTVSHLLSLRTASTPAIASLPFFGFFFSSDRGVHFRSRALKSRNAPVSSDVSEVDDDSSDGTGDKKSRNEKKRDARRAVRWGMKLASFSPAQIKRILRVASLQEEVFDALMLVKRFSRDVKEGKRRQYNYIGKLLREVEPELMDSLIQATIDGDQSLFKKLVDTETLDGDDDVEEEEDEIADGYEEEDPAIVAVVSRWYDGLINKDISITNEIYSLQDIEYDRQELRQLVRKVQSTLEYEDNIDDSGKQDIAAANARSSLTKFLHGLVAQLPAELVAMSGCNYE